MDEQTAVKRVLAEYEKLVQSSPRIQALEKKLAEGTITMKEGAELNDLRARAFGKALSGSVTGIERSSREGACVSLLKDRCADVDELALAAQKTALTRQGLNLTPPTAPFEEDRARKIGHSLEDDTVPDETIQRRARSATENMLNSQYDRNMKRGAETCASAGLKTYIVRDSGSGCCKWCDEVSGKFAYGTEPKDVYRRHDNCTCTVVYESGRGRQNVWSKQYWSAEQEREYLRLRDEMAPKRLNAKQAQALRERVGGLTFGGNIDIIRLGAKIPQNGLIKEHEAPRSLGIINYENKKDIKNKIDLFEKTMVGKEIEHAIVFTRDGKSYLCFGVNDEVYPNTDLGERIRGGTIAHNHPASEKAYSFSMTDIRLFEEYGLDILRGCDDKYIYELNRNPNDIDPVLQYPENEEEYQHSVVVNIARERGYGYRRWLRND